MIFQKIDQQQQNIERDLRHKCRTAQLEANRIGRQLAEVEDMNKDIDENNLNTGNPETTFCRRRNKIQGCASIRHEGKAAIEDGSSEARTDRASNNTNMPRRSARIQARKT
uniref:Uncharacterized protein n=1 Tax=Caenorhabditis japonica TaxID=281687 RepID=A0A8R1IS78_CAEJA